MIHNRFIKIFTVFSVLFIGCSGGNRFDVDISSTKIKVDFIDWNQSLSAKKPANFLKKISTDSKELYKYYLGSMIRVNPDQDSIVLMVLNQFMYFPAVIESQKEIDAVFGDFSDYKKQIENAFTYIKYHYPKTPDIKIYTYNSGFNYGVFPVGNEIGIGLEMYLGKENKVTQALPHQNFPDYLKANMVPQNLIPDLIRGYALLELIPEQKEDDLLATIVQEGKALLAMDAFLPEMEDHLKIRYSKEQLQWCSDNEKNIWKEVIDNKWLYDSNAKMIAQFTNESPFTATLPQDSPPRVGAWLGWQIVKAFADDNPELTLRQILDEKDSRKMLRSYKPKK